MSGTWRVGPAGVALLVVLGGCGGDTGTVGSAEAGTSRVGADEGRDAEPWPAAVVELRGPDEVPGPGHPTASGWAEVTLVTTRNEVCVEIAVDGLDAPTAAHLHRSAPGEAGDVVLALPAPTDGDGTVDACVTAEASVIEQLRDDPASYYVNVHTAAYPDGALRGQLH